MDHEQTGEPWYPIPPDPDEQGNPDPNDEYPETCSCGKPLDESGEHGGGYGSFCG